MSHKEIINHREPRARHEHLHFIFEGLEFPVDREELVRYVTDSEADIETQNLVRSLPDREYQGVDDVWRAMGEATRMLGGGARNLGSPRDDIGKQHTTIHQEVRRP